MSSGFYERLSTISSDPDSPDGMTELVVAALGSFGRYYICWKTRSGEYRQESSGLPTPLQQWLFPREPDANGQQRTRDFATLQVVLGRGDDFFAADRDGKIERKASPSTPDRTASPQSNNNSNHRSSAPAAAGGSATLRPPSLERAGSTTRRRSRTMSMAAGGAPFPTFRLSQATAAAAAAAVSPISELPRDRSSTATTGQRLSGGGGVKTTTTAMKPLVAGTRRNIDWRTRPRSIAFGEGELRVPEFGLRAAAGRGEQRQQQQLAPRGGRARGASSPSPPPVVVEVVGSVGEGEGGVEGQGACCKCGCHAATTTTTTQPAPSQIGAGVRQQRPTYATAATQAKMAPVEPPRPAYVDAGIQTDPPPPRTRRSTSSSSSAPRKRRSIAYSSFSSISYSSSGTSSSYESESETEPSSRRSSTELTDITTQSTYEGGVPSGNPVRMGKMQDYFRSSGYQLGDSLRPAQYRMGFDMGWARAWGD